MITAMEMSQSSISLPTDVQSKSYISSLCDVALNKNRERKDFESLLSYLISHPKECTPHKRKILEHLKVHGLENPNVDHKLLGSCFARAAVLFRQTPNKSEGAIGAWKSSLASELVNIEDNLNQLYSTVGISAKSVLEDSHDDIDIEDVDLEEIISKPSNDPDWQKLINSHLFKVNLAAHYVCALLRVRTEFNLPIPVLILLRIASRVGKFRQQSYRKKPKTNIKEYCYSLTPHLIAINLMLFRVLVDVLGTNVIPFIQLINSTLCELLEWTRTSHLSEHEINAYHSLRAQLFNVFANFMDQLSLNINLEPQSLTKLLESELVADIRSLFSDEPQVADSVTKSVNKDTHIRNAIKCLRSVFVAYRGLLEAKLELRVKSIVVETCIRMYNNFETNRVQIPIRKQLLELLLVIANQPFATSTTEICYNVFELADKLESDSEIKSLIRSALRVGLAHRPTIVSHYDVYSVYGHGMASALEADTEQPTKSVDNLDDTPDSAETPETVEVDNTKTAIAVAVTTDSPVRREPEKVSDIELVEIDVEETDANEVQVVEQVANSQTALTTTPQVEASDLIQVEESSEVTVAVEEKEAEVRGNETGSDNQEQKEGEKDEDELLVYMQDFVEKLA